MTAGSALERCSRLLASVCVTAVVLAAGTTVAAAGIRVVAPAEGPLTTSGRYLLDPEGRIVILHGLFAAWKQPPYYPVGMDDPNSPATPSFTDSDARLVQSFGFDGVRLSWYWQGLEPTQRSYSATYLDGVAAAESKFASRHVYVVLDAHQDQYDELFGNKPGFPLWSAVADGEPLAPAPSDPGYSGWKFPLGYFHSSTELAFGNLYANTRVGGEGIRTAFARAWQHLVRRFIGDRMVVGYDLVNEPFPATASPTSPYVGACASPRGCAAFDARTLEPFQTAVARSIRRLDPRRPVFFEPTFFFNSGVPTHFAAPSAVVRPVGLSFHNQCPSRTAYSLTHDPTTIVVGHETCPPISARVFRNAAITAAKLGGPALMTEVASTSDGDVQGLNCMFEQADHFQTSYMYGLSWSNPDDELRRLGEESSSTGAAPFKELILARVYPRAVSGVPETYGFDVRTGRFWLRYRAKPRMRAATMISIPTAVQYPSGYKVQVAGANRISRPDAELLEVVNIPGARTVTVEVTPVPGRDVARPGFPACKLG